MTDTARVLCAYCGGRGEREYNHEPPLSVCLDCCGHGFRERTLYRGERERIAREVVAERLDVVAWEEDFQIPEFGLVTKDAVLAFLFPEVLP